MRTGKKGCPASLFLFFGKFLFGFLGLFEVQHHPVDTVPQAGRRRAVIKNVTQVRFTAPAHDFSAFHAVGIVGRINNAALGDGLVKAGPAAPALELRIADEQGITANGAVIGALVRYMLERAAPGPFGAFLPGNVVNVGGKDFFPFCVIQGDLGIVGVGIHRIIFLFSGIHTDFFCWLGISAKLQTQCKG